VATNKGHLDQRPKNVRTTITVPNTSTTKENQTNQILPQIPEQEPNNKSTQALFATIKTTGKIYANQTGQFPVTSSRGSQYIMVLYEYEANAILTEPLKNWTGGEILRGYKNYTNIWFNAATTCAHIGWITKHPRPSKHSTKQMPLNTNWYHHTIINKMRQNKQSARGKIISWLDFAVPIKNSRYTYGTDY
jgi:hypothetical protein